MKLNIITCCTDTPRFLWEAKVFLQNMKEFDLLSKVTILIFQHRNFFEKEFSPEWKQMEEKFPEANFVYYKDTNNITRIGTIFNYVPIFRLWVLEQYFKKHPELEQEAIFYVDTDIIITSPLDFDKFLQDDICYVSWTGNPERTDNYLWHKYFDNKHVEVIPEKLHLYEKYDVLGKVAKICGTTREVVEENSPNIGGAQYLLKGINSQFWTDAFNACCEIKIYLDDVNKNFMQGKTWQEKSNRGFQAFCADMWAVLFTLFKYGKKVESPKELDFAWSTDRIERLDSVHILHNAGVTTEESIKVAFERGPNGERIYEDGPLFYKGKYLASSPLSDLGKLLDTFNHPVNKKFCNNRYIAAILKTI